jgi:8-oxo-dGTP pyrophosphatase MutT (NUDIX family)
MIEKAESKIQYAALPFRRRTGQGLEVLLITSRETGRWVIPKGWLLKKLAPHKSAALEAREEAGVIGRINKRPIGAYPYKKLLNDGSTIRCRVCVFALEVEKQLPSWLEQDQRQTKWFNVRKAAKVVKEPQLRAIIWNLNSLLLRND